MGGGGNEGCTIGVRGGGTHGFGAGDVGDGEGDIQGCAMGYWELPPGSLEGIMGIRGGVWDNEES